MSAQPGEHHEDPLDPERILRELPDRERANFLAAYREALDGARDPAGWGHLRRVLRLWSGMVVATNRPGFYEAQEAALTGTGGGMLLEELVTGRSRPSSSSCLSCPTFPGQGICEYLRGCLHFQQLVHDFLRSPVPEC